MTCNECKMRDTCVTICPDMEIYLSKFHGYQHEMPLGDNDLIFQLEDSLRANKAQYIDRHSDYLPELERRMKRLTRPQREIVEMYFFEGESIPIIARKLRIAPNSAFKRLKRAIVRLRKSRREKGV